MENWWVKLQKKRTGFDGILVSSPGLRMFHFAPFSSFVSSGPERLKNPSGDIETVLISTRKPHLKQRPKLVSPSNRTSSSPFSSSDLHGVLGFFSSEKNRF